MDIPGYNIPFVVYLPQYKNEQTDIRLAGSIEELGNWKPEQAVKFVMLTPGIWKIIVNINGIKEIEWKYLEYKCNEQHLWQQGQNQKITTSLFHDYIQNQEYNCDSFTIMSFNIRYLNDQDGVNHWDNRKKLVSKILLDWKADFIGLQEVVEEQAQDIKFSVGQKYGYVGRSRSANPRFGEASPILHDLSKWTCINNETVWLCDTPKVPGTLCFGSRLPRVVTLGIFFNNYTHELIRVVNTHFDLDKDAQLKSVPVLCSTIKESQEKDGYMPTFLVGDFNSDRESKVIQLVLDNKEMKFVDLIFNLFIIQQRLSPHKINTFHGFQGSPTHFNAENDNFKAEIDHIFYSGPEIQLLVYDKIQDGGYKIDGYQVYPSDHDPIFCIINKK